MSIIVPHLLDDNPRLLEQDFLQLLPQVQRHASWYFRHLNGEDRDDAVADAIVHAFVQFTRLVRRGIDPTRFSTLLIKYAASHVRDGRRVGTRRSSKDVLSSRARLSKGFYLGPLSDEALLDRQTPVPDQVAFRIDFPKFLRSLPARHQAIALALAEGVSAQQVAQSFGISAARVTQLRKAWLAHWLDFQGEKSVGNSDCTSH